MLTRSHTLSEKIDLLQNKINQIEEKIDTISNLIALNTVKSFIGLFQETQTNYKNFFIRLGINIIIFSLVLGFTLKYYEFLIT